jgi:hypothetical protein
MKLLSIEKTGVKFIIWYADDENYVKAIVSKKNQIEVDVTVPISRYPAGRYGGRKKLTSYEYFAAVMGKFNPYTVFWIEPIEVDSLDYNKLLDIERRQR